MKHLLFVASERLPNPTGNGVSVLQHGLLQCFRALGYEVTIVPFGLQYAARGEEEAHRSALRADGTDVIDLPPDDLALPVWLLRRLRRLVVRSRWDLVPFSRASANALNALAAQRSADIVLGFGWASVALVGAVKGRLRVASLVDLMNMAAEIRETAAPATNLPKRAYDFLANREWHRAHDNGLRSLRTFDLVLEHAFHHAQLLRREGVERVFYLPHPLHVPLRGSAPPESADGVVRILMPGSLKGLASLRGFRFLLDEVLPRLRERRQSLRAPYRIRVVGHGRLPEATHEALVAAPEIDFVGYAEDIFSEFRNAQVMLVTIPVELGFRTRIAEACGHGLCSVVHAANCAGMPELKDGDNVLSSSTADGLVDRIIVAINDPDARSRIGDRARETFSTSYSIDSAVPKIASWIDSVSGARSKRAPALAPPL